VFIEAMDDGSGGDNWSYKLCKDPDKSSPPTNNTQFFYRPDAFLCPTNVKALKGKTTNNLHLWANIGTYMSTVIQFFFQKGDVFY